MNCRYVARDSPRIIPGRHLDTCPQESRCDDGNFPPRGVPACQGCQPCEERHCQLQWHGTSGDCQIHADTICAACLGKTREHLAEVVRLTGIPLVAETLNRGTRSEAADLLAPTADPYAWYQRSRHGHTWHPDARLGDNHPNWVLGTWTLRAAMHLGHIGPNTTTPATYLNTHLADLTSWEDFPEMAADLRDCRTHLEAVLHDGEQVDRGAPCPTCRTLLEKRWDVGQLGRDGWWCSKCKIVHTADQYDFRMKADYVEHAEWLRGVHIQQRFGVSPGTLRRWANGWKTFPASGPVFHPPIVRKKPDGVESRNLYSVADVQAALGVNEEESA